MAVQWPKKRRLMGGKHTRADGAEKSTGRAKYSYDINRKDMLHAVIVRCPHPHAKVKNVDLSAAEKAPGYKGAYFHNEAGAELYFPGAEVVSIAADTEEHARDAARLVKVEYDVLPFIVRESQGLEKDPQTVFPVGPKKERQNVRPAQERKSDDFDEGVKAAEVSVEGTYGMPVISHQCLESHGMVAEWNKDRTELTVWASTQAVFGITNELIAFFGAKYKLALAGKVKVICHHMGAGYGSKFNIHEEGRAAADLAYQTKQPVKLMLDRASEVTTAGYRPSARGKVKISGKKDGTITAFEADTVGTPGHLNAGSTVGPMPYVYLLPHKVRHQVVRTNAGGQRAMRAPGHPQSCFFTDCAIDDFAAKIGMDPLQVRLKNLPKNDEEAVKNDPLSYAAIRGTLYRQQIETAAKLAGWKDKWHEPGKTKGPIKRGIGMALHTWGGQASPQPNDCTVIIASDGSVTVQSSTQDLGTAQRTVSALVTAEILGLEPKDITVQLGETQFGRSTGSGGSTTCPSQAPATLIAATAARDELFNMLAKPLGCKPEDLEIGAPGKIRNKAKDESYDWKKAVARLGKNQAKGTGTWTFAESQKKENAGVSKLGVGGVQIAEVLVDTETGVVKLVQIVAVQDCGLIVNKLACESQVAGGVIMGLNYAMYEEIITDRVTGRVVNPDMEFYKLGGINDMPKIIVHMMDMPERGVIGIGEPPTISTHAAIGNAIFNAIGVRVGETPFTPDRVLAALAKGGK